MAGWSMSWNGGKLAQLSTLHSCFNRQEKWPYKCTFDHYASVNSKFASEVFRPILNLPPPGVQNRVCTCNTYSMLGNFRKPFLH